MRGIYFLCLLVLPLIVTGCAALSGPTLVERTARNAQLFDQAQVAITGTAEKKPDNAAAAAYYQRAARNGSAQAAYALAAIYRDNQVTKGDDAATREEAFFWMHDAAVGGWPQAQYELAVFYHEGKGVAPDPEESLKWLESAAKAEHVLAQRFLGALYLNGANAGGNVTVKPNPQKGASWYLRAAYNGDGPSQAVMGTLYMTGKGIEKDSIQAIKWNRLAAGKGMAGAQKRLLALYADQKRKSNYEQAILLYREDFAKGDQHAGYNLGRLFYYAPAPYNNTRQAVKLFQTTAGVVGSSALMLGVASEEGKGVPQNFSDAVSWYKKAIELGQNEAYAYLGAACLDGRGMPENETEAVALFRAGAGKGDAKSQRRLAVLYTQGKGVPYDYEKALHWSVEAAKNGDVQAMYLAAAMYEKGIGTSRNMVEARRWYQQAADFSPEQSEAVREEAIAPWKRDSQKALERLDKEMAEEKARQEAGTSPSEGSLVSPGNIPAIKTSRMP